jgi:hypothetical protein
MFGQGDPSPLYLVEEDHPYSRFGVDCLPRVAACLWEEWAKVKSVTRHYFNLVKVKTDIERLRKSCTESQTRHLLTIIVPSLPRNHMLSIRDHSWSFIQEYSHRISYIRHHLPIAIGIARHQTLVFNDR